MRILGIILVLFLSSCALTYETPHRCELMQRGEPCLSNHACCKPPTTYYYYNSYPRDNWWYNIRKNTYTNYVIVKPNNNKPNNKPKPNRKPRHRK